MPEAETAYVDCSSGFGPQEGDEVLSQSIILHIPHAKQAEYCHDAIASTTCSSRHLSPARLPPNLSLAQRPAAGQDLSCLSLMLSVTCTGAFTRAALAIKGKKLLVAMHLNHGSSLTYSLQHLSQQTYTGMALPTSECHRVPLVGRLDISLSMTCMLHLHDHPSHPQSAT